jgi:hypothetical protein
MQITEHTAGDIERLKHLIDRETRAKRRDRLRITLLALQGFEKLQVAEVMGISKSTVEYWAYAYRHRGIAASRHCRTRIAADGLARSPAIRHECARDASTPGRPRVTGSARFALRTSSESPGTRWA